VRRKHINFDENLAMSKVHEGEKKPIRPSILWPISKVALPCKMAQHISIKQIKYVGETIKKYRRHTQETQKQVVLFLIVKHSSNCDVIKLFWL